MSQRVFMAAELLDDFTHEEDEEDREILSQYAEMLRTLAKKYQCTRISCATIEMAREQLLLLTQSLECEKDYEAARRRRETA